MIVRQLVDPLVLCLWSLRPLVIKETGKREKGSNSDPHDWRCSLGECCREVQAAIFKLSFSIIVLCDACFFGFGSLVFHARLYFRKCHRSLCQYASQTCWRNISRRLDSIILEAHNRTIERYSVPLQFGLRIQKSFRLRRSLRPCSRLTTHSWGCGYRLCPGLITVLSWACILCHILWSVGQYSILDTAFRYLVLLKSDGNDPVCCSARRRELGVPFVDH